MHVTIHLPRQSAAKLAELGATSGSALLRSRVEHWLATIGASGCHFAPAPPVGIFVAGGAGLLSRIDAIRSSVERLTASINSMVAMATDIHALLDLDDNAAFDAMVAHRLNLERQEEALVSVALATGLRVDRRPDADPRAVLELTDMDELVVGGNA